MAHSPAVVELGEVVSGEEVSKTEEVEGLYQDEEVINFVEEVIADVDSVEEDDEPADHEAQVAKPSLQECLMRMLLLNSVSRIEPTIVIAKSGVRKVEVAIRGAYEFLIFKILRCLKKSIRSYISGYGLIGGDVIGEIGSVVQLID